VSVINDKWYATTIRFGVDLTYLLSCLSQSYLCNCCWCRILL